MASEITTQQWWQDLLQYLNGALGDTERLLVGRDAVPYFSIGKDGNCRKAESGEFFTYSSIASGPIVIDVLGGEAQGVREVALRFIQTKYEAYSDASDAVMRNLGILFHDARNSLGSISGITQLMALDIEPGTELEQSLTDISEVINRYEVSAKSVMKLYRKEPLNPSVESVDLTALWNAIIQKRARVFALSEIGLETSVDENLVMQCNKEQLETVLNELVGNAFDALSDSQGEKQISINCFKEDTNICLIVKDSGCGVSWEHQLFVFEQFMSTKKKRKGVGLSTVERYITDMDGVVSYQSEPGNGSEFTVKIPVTV